MRRGNKQNQNFISGEEKYFYSHKANRLLKSVSFLVIQTNLTKPYKAVDECELQLNKVLISGIFFRANFTCTLLFHFLKSCLPTYTVWFINGTSLYLKCLFTCFLSVTAKLRKAQVCSSWKQCWLNWLPLESVVNGTA